MMTHVELTIEQLRTSRKLAEWQFQRPTEPSVEKGKVTTAPTVMNERLIAEVLLRR